MKKAVLLIILGIISSLMINAQSVAYIESETILTQLPEYQQAKTELDAKSKEWKQAVEAKLNEVETMYNKYVAERSILSESAQQKRQDEIIEAEKKAKEFKDAKFGQEGEFTKLEKTKMDPIFEKMQKAVETTAMEAGYAYVFDKSSTSNWLYTSKTYDITDLVLKKLLGK